MYANIYTYIFIYMYTYICVYIYIYIVGLTRKEDAPRGSSGLSPHPHPETQHAKRSTPNPFRGSGHLVPDTRKKDREGTVAGLVFPAVGVAVLLALSELSPLTPIPETLHMSACTYILVRVYVYTTTYCHSCAYIRHATRKQNPGPRRDGGGASLPNDLI